VKPGKIVAGQEAEKTNEWLQAMYIAATSGKDFKAVIRKMGGKRREEKKEESPKAKPEKPKPPEKEPPETKPKKEEPKKDKSTYSYQSLEPKKEPEPKEEPPKVKPAPEKRKVKPEPLPDFNEVDNGIHNSLNQVLTLILNRQILPSMGNLSRKQWRILRRMRSN
jgi:hypothetical protein